MRQLKLQIVITEMLVSLFMAASIALLVLGFAAGMRANLYNWANSSTVSYHAMSGLLHSYMENGG